MRSEQYYIGSSFHVSNGHQLVQDGLESSFIVELEQQCWLKTCRDPCILIPQAHALGWESLPPNIIESEQLVLPLGEKNCVIGVHAGVLGTKSLGNVNVKEKAN